MKQIQQIQSKSVVTIGNFDGLHKGHLKLITKTLSLAKKHNLKSLVCSFNRNTKGADNIITTKQLKDSLTHLGLDYFASLNFFEEIKPLSCAEFTKEYLCNRFKAQYVVVGEDFRFGVWQSGNVETLKELGKQYGFSVIVLKNYKINGLVLSSSFLRTLLKNGNLRQANRYLYQPFSIAATVKKGFRVGGDLLNYPTANLNYPKNLVSLPHGVYSTITTIEGIPYQSITNYGIAPTYRKSQPTIETHILHYNGDLYSKKITVTFLKYLRKERKFASMDALKKQIEKDLQRL